MKRFWVSVQPWEKKRATAAIEAGADALVVDREHVSDARELGIVQVISKADDADCVLGRDVDEVTITKKEDEEQVVARGGKVPVIIRTSDWTIIPLENLISKTTNLIQAVRTAADAKVALETMERGADGVLLETTEVGEIQKTGEVVRAASAEQLSITTAAIVSIENVGLGDRVCIDTTHILPPGHGMLVGDSSAGMFLVHNENVPSCYCDPRPFRVNAGAVHAYIRLPENKTKYLSEIESGMRVLVTEPSGASTAVTVGRAKIERRPLLKVTARAQDGQIISLVLQNAETIRLTAPDGAPISVTALTEGARVIVYTEQAGRHFGEQMSETITEH